MLEKYYLSFCIQNFFIKDVKSIFITRTSYLASGRTHVKSVPIVFKFISTDLLFRYKSLIDLWCTDYLNLDVHQVSGRFEVRYVFRSFIHLLSDFSYSVICKDDYRYIFSISNLFSSSSWLEREVWDLFGIFFSGNLDLRRILTDYGFSGHPFQKDFPLSGYQEIYYSDENAGIISESVSLPLNFRDFKK